MIFEDSYAEILLPLALEGTFTYLIPEELKDHVAPGVRVEVQFGKNRIYSGLVIGQSTTPPADQKIKPILTVLDYDPIIGEAQLNLWRWMSQYYMCSLGEVMNAALPSGLKLSSETAFVRLKSEFDLKVLTKNEEIVLNNIPFETSITRKHISTLTGIKNLYPSLRSLMEKRLVVLKEELNTGYRQKMIPFVQLHEPYFSDRSSLEDAFEKIKNAKAQTRLLLAFLQLEKQKSEIEKKLLLQVAAVSPSALTGLQEKGILEIFEQAVSRLKKFEGNLEFEAPLTPQQINAVSEIKRVHKENKVALLHGVTGSGKTRVYLEFIKKAIKANKQVLLLMPEIALTGHIESRLKKYLGDDLLEYHSRISSHKRVETWMETLNGKAVVIGARSALFLPFQNLDYIIVDEEHDGSYRQHEPAPRYNARDSAIYLGHQTGAKIILGSATPALDSYRNAQTKKYGLVNMPDRFGGLQLPISKIINLKEARRKKQASGIFSQEAIEAIEAQLGQQKQVILFQNRRGFAPMINCLNCDWYAECPNCDVRLTFHKYVHKMICHYCGHKASKPSQCPSCKSNEVGLWGYGTQQIEESAKEIFPNARIARLDLDTARSRNRFNQLMDDFDAGELDILIGTQMITKGLDFDRVGLAVVLQADQILHYPDYRANERAFQMLMQVSGRAGRKKEQGMVLIQTSQPDHEVLTAVTANDLPGLYDHELEQRDELGYPPSRRMIRIVFRHMDFKTVQNCAKDFVGNIQGNIIGVVLGPTQPMIPRVRNNYIQHVLIKLKSGADLVATKEVLLKSRESIKLQKAHKPVRIHFEVDP